jgi:hypothetical protein
VKKKEKKKKKKLQCIIYTVVSVYRIYPFGLPRLTSHHHQRNFTSRGARGAAAALPAGAGLSRMPVGGF